MGIRPKLIGGEPGQFDVVVDGVVVATRSKKFWDRLLGGGWPEPSEVVAQLRSAAG